MKHLTTAVALGFAAISAQAATPSSGTLNIHETEIEFTNGPIIGVNPTPASSDATGVICDPALNHCDTFALTVDLPEDIRNVFPTALVRMVITWDDFSGSGSEDFDFYVYDEAGNEIGSSATDAQIETVTLLANPGTTNYRLDVIYFAVLGSTYTGKVTLDLGEPSEEADLEAFYAENPPGLAGFLMGENQDPEAVARADARGLNRSGGGGLGWLLISLVGLAGLRSVRR